MNTGDPKLDTRSKRRLLGVHPKLVKLMQDFAARTEIKFIVVEGIRSVDRQRELVQAGASRTMNSKHLTGRAVDLAVILDGELRWDWPLYQRLANRLVDFADAQGIHLVAGANWPRFRDGPHFELGPKE
jgi:peptidoglycan L-alanyl-D-glutamate endopeptidase CwlK